MLSRVAEAIYWMERYRERAENTARFIDVNLSLNMDVLQEEKLQWAPIVRTTGDYPLFESLYSKATEKNVLEFLTFDTRNPNSIINCVASARENARAIRQTIITEMWQEFNTLYLFIQKTARNRGNLISRSQFYDRIKRQSQLVLGIGQTTMSHNEAWHFGRLGNFLERADKTSRILDVKYFILLPDVKYVGTPYDNIHWAALLKSATGFEMYKKQWRRISPDNVLHFLILNPSFPRSIMFCIQEAFLSLATIESLSGAPGNSRPHVLLGNLMDFLTKTKTQDIIDYGVHEFLNDIQVKLIDINDSLYRLYFSRFDFDQ